MKKVFAIAVTAVSMMGMIGCSGLTDPSTAPQVTLETIGAVAAGSNVTVSKVGKVTASDSIKAVSVTVMDSSGATVAASLTGLDYSANVTSGINTKSVDFSVSIKAASTVASGKYTLKVNATIAGGTAGSGEFAFTVTGGTAGTVLTVKATDTLWNVFGPVGKYGAYNLVSSAGVSSSSAATTKDLLDITAAATISFVMKFGSGNGTVFATATTAQYDAATNVSVKTLGDAATLSTTAVLTMGDVIVAKLGGSRGYAIIKILKAQPDGTGNNSGYLAFEYKFTAN